MDFQRSRDYELVMVLSPETNEEEISAAVERVGTFVAGRGGNVSHQESWGLRRLAYPIQRFQEGNYVLTRFSLDPAAILELDRSLITSSEVLRHLVVRL